MIPAVTQTLASLLADETSLTGTEQIDFNPPGRCQGVRPRLNLYCYDLRQSLSGHPSFQCRVHQASQNSLPPGCTTSLAAYPVESADPIWFDLSFLISAWDWTELGEQRLLSEALTLLLRHRLLGEDRLAPALSGWGKLSVSVSRVPLGEIAALWQALGAPLRPALYVTVTVPVPASQSASVCNQVLLSSLR